MQKKYHTEAEKAAAKKAVDLKYRQKNRKKLVKKQQAYRLDHPEEEQARSAAYYEANREEKLAYFRQRYADLTPEEKAARIARTMKLTKKRRKLKAKLQQQS